MLTEKRTEVFRQKGRGGVFDAKLLIVRGYGVSNDVLCWRDCITKIVNQHILSLCLPLSNIMVYRFVIDKVDKSTVLWLEQYILQDFPVCASRPQNYAVSDPLKRRHLETLLPPVLV